jgi:hypothetical protein
LLECIDADVIAVVLGNERRHRLFATANLLEVRRTNPQLVLDRDWYFK